MTHEILTKKEAKKYSVCRFNYCAVSILEALGSKDPSEQLVNIVENKIKTCFPEIVRLERQKT